MENTANKAKNMVNTFHTTLKKLTVIQQILKHFCDLQSQDDVHCSEVLAN